MSTVGETLEHNDALSFDEELPELSNRVTVIKPAPKLPHLDLRELWQYRELAATFAWRDIKVRYKQTAIGVAWALLQPFTTMVVLTLIFGKFAKFPSQGLPYPIFLYSAQLPWTYFSSAFTQSAASLSQNSTLVTKIYFPRVLLPLAAITVPFVDFLLASTILAGMMVYYHVGVHVQLLAAPLFILLAAVTALGTGLIFAVANVRYRDVPYVIPFLVQIWFYGSGTVFPIASLKPAYQWILAVNPVSGVMTGFRWALVGTPPPHAGPFAVSVASAGLIFLVGLTVFRRAEPRFADTI
jgi:lipopolysaccharide transport system permease protein